MSVPSYPQVRCGSYGNKRDRTDLHTDGADKANVIVLGSSKVFRELTIVRATIVELGLAACHYNCLCGQIDYVCQASV